jgi:hypothetical protein
MLRLQAHYCHVLAACELKHKHRALFTLHCVHPSAAAAAAAGWAFAGALLFQLLPILAAYFNSPDFSLSHVLKAVTANIHLVRGAPCCCCCCCCTLEAWAI